MTSITAGGAFYRIQNALEANSREVSNSMQRLATGEQNISAGENVSTRAIALGIKGELASLKVGMQNGSEALNAIEMVTNDIKILNDIVIRLEELNALGENGLNSATDVAAIKAEATALLTEFDAVQTRSTWKGNAIFGGAGSDNLIGLGKNSGQVNGTGGLVLDAVTPTADAKLVTDTAISVGTADSTLTTTAGGLESLKKAVDAQQVAAGAMYNQISNTMEHLTNLSASYSLDMGSKLDVDFAGETTNLAKGQILAQAGTAMLAQANAQGQSLLALIQS
ncbi:flagellin [Planktomarina temperata]|nr:flagellin [Planktomarina temperata]